MKNKDIYIKILEFGIKHIEGFNYDKIIKAKELKNLKKSEIEIIDRYFLNAFRNKHKNSMNNPTDPETMFVLIEGGGSNHKDKMAKYTLNLDSRFKYIDYIELKEARDMAKKADKNSKIALWAVVITTIISILISFLLTRWQIESPIEINENQFNTLLESSKK